MANVISGGELASIKNPFTQPPASWGAVAYEGPLTSLSDLKGLGEVDPLFVWASQPSVRKVVDFIARALASTPLKAYRRVSDTDRQRVVGEPISAILARPAPGMIPFRLWHSVIVDWLLFDRWCMVKTATQDTSRPVDLTRVQAARIGFSDDGLANVLSIWVDGRRALDPADCLFDHGYAPILANGTSPMATLSAILEESREAVAYRRSVWKNSARVPVVIERPTTAPTWTDTARDRFLAGWRSYMRGGGSEGGTPLLQDGMTLAKVDAFSPQDTQDIAGRQLNDAEVASAYHIAPELVGAREGTNSNIDAFREMLYGDALGPYYEPLQEVVNAMLVPDLDPTGQVYVEFDIEAKMRGSFDTQAAVFSTAVGRPFMTAAEVRGRLNLRDLGGDTDELVTPLNVLIGGQASPRDTGSQNLATAPKAMQRLGKAQHALVKARTVDAFRAQAEKALTRFFTTQRDAVLAALDKKAATDWWDGNQWNAQLTDTLYGVAAAVASEIGGQASESLGFTPGDYDPARTVSFLKAVSARNAENINESTREQISAALASDDEAATPASVFALAAASRVPAAAVQIVTASSGFATTEAARQLGQDRAMKTWVTGPHPRKSHADLDGQTVGIDDLFGNGLKWPGDGGDADEVAGCNCGVSVSISDA